MYRREYSQYIDDSDAVTIMHLYHDNPRHTLVQKSNEVFVNYVGNRLHEEWYNSGGISVSRSENIYSNYIQEQVHLALDREGFVWNESKRKFDNLTPQHYDEVKGQVLNGFVLSAMHFFEPERKMLTRNLRTDLTGWMQDNDQAPHSYYMSREDALPIVNTYAHASQRSPLLPPSALISLIGDHVRESLGVASNRFTEFIDQNTHVYLRNNLQHAFDEPSQQFQSLSSDEYMLHRTHVLEQFAEHASKFYFNKDMKFKRLIAGFLN